MSKVEIFDAQAFVEALRFAKSIGKIDELINAIDRFACNNHDVKLFKDFEPYSFTFDVSDPRGFNMNGGLIYHGPLPSGATGGHSSIQLCPSDGWSLHT